jgi:hypothetical protein
MRESRTYGSGRGACDETHVPTATLPWALRTRMDETGRSLIPKRFRIKFLGRRREFITLLGSA